MKRESKVLEIVRREAIGTGGSLFSPRAVQRRRRRKGLRERGACRKRPRPVSVFWRESRIQSGERASIGFVIQSGDRWAPGRAWRAGLTAVSHQRDPVIPVTAGAEEPTTHVREGEAVASSRRAHVRGSGTDARAAWSVVCGAGPSTVG